MTGENTNVEQKDPKGSTVTLSSIANPTRVRWGTTR